MNLSFFSSCVDESQLCRGMGLCPKNEDLKWCKKGQRILTIVENGSLPFENYWKPLDGHSECPLPNSKLIKMERGPIEKNLRKFIETVEPYESKLLSSHQQIETAKIRDGVAYQCFNRGDETPFYRAIDNSIGEKIETSWDHINTPCKHTVQRRCFGKEADECVHYRGT